ncbi:MAG: ABC transporter substrate-binding protein [Nocardioidaceae bacterium]|nr:ABC transporter substrate-binding protein [Nocardioidaceae bacterium]
MKKPAVATLAAAALLALAACGGGSGGGNATDNETLGAGGAAGSFKNADAKAPLAVPSDASQGGTLTVLTNQVPATLDPTRAYFTDSTAIMSDLVTRALTQYAYNEKTNDMQLIPDMATDLGKPSEDNKEWTFTLRDGLKYEDGTPVKAEDVAYAVKRSFAIAELPDGPTYNTTFFLDGDKYKGPFKDGDNYQGVVVNGNDVTIKMRRPFTDMDYYASFPQFTAIPKAKDNPETYEQHPLATGPYKFVDYKPGSSLTLTKNDQWDPNTDPGRLQAVDGWDFKFGQDTAKLENIIINDKGSAQTTLTYDNVSASSYRQIAQDKQRLVRGTSPCTYMWYLDMKKITDLKVREAIGWGFPYRNYWKAGGEIEGVTRVPGTSILPPGTAGRVEYDALGNKGVQTDPAKAKALLKEAGYKPGEYEIKFLFASDDDLAVSSKNEIVKGLTAAGFKATPIASTSETIRTDRTDPDSAQNVRSSGWCSDWPSGTTWFPAQWAGNLVGVEGMPNPAQFKVKKMDDEQDRILDTLSPAQVPQAWGEFDKTMETTYYPAVNLGYSGTAMIRGSRVGGMANDNIRGMPTFARMYITR